MEGLALNISENGGQNPLKTGCAKRQREKHWKVRKCDPKTCNVASILSSMREEQREHHFGKLADAYLKYRRVVSEWMLDVCDYFGLHPTTSHAAVAYLDRLQPNEKFSRFEWQMLAICCILISSKYNESEEDVPDLATLEDITHQQIPNETVLNYELWALKRIGWKLNARTPLAFLASYVVCGGIARPTDRCYSKLQVQAEHQHEEQEEHQQIQSPSQPTQMSAEELEERVTEGVYSLAASCLLESDLKPFKASDLACAILFSVRQSLAVHPVWSAEMTALTNESPYTAPVMEALAVMEARLAGRNEFFVIVPDAVSADVSADDSAVFSLADLASSEESVDEEDDAGDDEQKQSLDQSHEEVHEGVHTPVAVRRAYVTLGAATTESSYEDDINSSSISNSNKGSSMDTITLSTPSCLEKQGGGVAGKAAAAATGADGVMGKGVGDSATSPFSVAQLDELELTEA